MNRRVFFKKGTLAFGGLVATTLFTTQASAKQGKDVVKYQPTPKDGKKCIDCVYFTKPDGCKLVSGEIKKDGWCKLYNEES